MLHRDLKPGNILLDIDGQPHVTDFGLAKKLDDSSQTRTGAVMGTPSYMPPEQAAGRTRDMGPASDVYSLGAILYELITGRPPFASDTALDTLMHVMERDPAPPRLLNPKVARDLETICLKCLEKDPRERYATAESLANDLQRYIDGDSISARSLNVFDRLAHTLDRNQYLTEFSSWGNMVLVFAVVVLVEHVFVFAITRDGTRIRGTGYSERERLSSSSWPWSSGANAATRCCRPARPSDNCGRSGSATSWRAVSRRWSTSRSTALPIRSATR